MAKLPLTALEWRVRETCILPDTEDFLERVWDKSLSEKDYYNRLEICYQKSLCYLAKESDMRNAWYSGATSDHCGGMLYYLEGDIHFIPCEPPLRWCKRKKKG